MCLRKSDESVERVSVSNDIEKLDEQDIHYMIRYKRRHRSVTKATENSY